MSAFFEMCLVFFACVGVLTVVWLLVGYVVRPRGCEPATFVAEAGSATELIAVVQRFEWMRQWGMGDMRLLMLTDSMDADTLDMALSLARDEPAVRLCARSEIRGRMSE